MTTPTSPLTARQLCERATPGPWTHAIGGKEPNAPIMVSGNRPAREEGALWPMALVCYVYPNDSRHPSFCETQEERDANAELISRLSPATVLAVVEALTDAHFFIDDGLEGNPAKRKAMCLQIESALALLNGEKTP